MPPKVTSDDWAIWSMYVVNKIDESDAKIDKLTTRLTDMHLSLSNDITALKVRAGMWGALGGMILGTVVSIVVSAVLAHSVK